MRSALTASAACFVAWLCFPLLPAHARPDRPSSEKLASRIEEYLTARAEHSRLSGSVLLARNGQTTQFYLKEADVTVEFARRSSGDVTHLTLLQNNRHLKAMKIPSPAAAHAPEQANPGPASPSVQMPLKGEAAPAGARP